MLTKVIKLTPITGGWRDAYVQHGSRADMSGTRGHMTIAHCREGHHRDHTARCSTTDKTRSNIRQATHNESRALLLVCSRQVDHGV